MKYIETDKHFYKQLLTIALPVAAQSVITTGVNLVDNIMLGQLGEVAMGGSSLANGFIQLFTFLCMGIAMGSSVLTSRFWGAKDIKSLKKVITIALRFALGLGLAFTLVNALFARPIMSIYTPEQDIIEAGTIYLQWSTATFLLMGMSTVCMNIMRSVNLTIVPFAASCAAFGVNIGANYILIFGKLGMPKMGIAGAALGTVIARVVEASVICGYFLFVNKSVGYRIKDIFTTKCRDLLKEFLVISVPVMLSDGFLGVAENVLQVIMGHIGGAFLAANNITMVVQRVSNFFVTGLAFSGCFIIGHTLGEKKVEQAKKQGYTFAILGIVVGALAMGIIRLIREPVIAMYPLERETVEIARALMDAVGLITLFRATNSILTKGVLRGGGDTTFLLIVDSVTVWCFAVFTGWLAGLVFLWPAFWVFMALHFDQIVKAIWCFFRLKSGKWVKKIRGSEDVVDKEATQANA